MASRACPISGFSASNTHRDRLPDKFQEDRVRRVVEPLLIRRLLQRGVSQGACRLASFTGTASLM